MRYLRVKLVGLALSLCLSACATPSSQSPHDNLALNLAQMMQGRFEAPLEGPESGFLDHRISLPALGEGQWIYHQVNKGTEAVLYRQRVLQLLPEEDGSVRQVTYRLKNETNFANLWDTDKSISRKDLIPAFTTGCEQIWEKEATLWVSEIDPQNCVIDSKHGGRKIGIASRARLSADSLQQGEAGYKPDGTFLWGTPEGEWITLERQ